MMIWIKLSEDDAVDTLIYSNYIHFPVKYT